MLRSGIVFRQKGDRRDYDETAASGVLQASDDIPVRYINWVILSSSGQRAWARVGYRLVHNAHRIELSGESLRRARGKRNKAAWTDVIAGDTTSIGQRASPAGRHHSVTVGGIIQEFRAALSPYTGAPSSESALMADHRGDSTRVFAGSRSRIGNDRGVGTCNIGMGPGDSKLVFRGLHIL
jgi:hypothetical protein